jgi:hypothetical protein
MKTKKMSILKRVMNFVTPRSIEEIKKGEVIETSP